MTRSIAFQTSMNATKFLIAQFEPSHHLIHQTNLELSCWCSTEVADVSTSKPGDSFETKLRMCCFDLVISSSCPIWSRMAFPFAKLHIWIRLLKMFQHIEMRLWVGEFRNLFNKFRIFNIPILLIHGIQILISLFQTCPSASNCYYYLKFSHLHQ